MIINRDVYECPKCDKWYFFETSKTYSKICPICNVEMKFCFNADCDTELAEKVKNTPPYDPKKDPQSPYYIPMVECPYCHGTNTKKITYASRSLSMFLFGINSKKIGKQFHCNNCGADF